MDYPLIFVSTILFLFGTLMDNSCVWSLVLAWYGGGRRSCEMFSLSPTVRLAFQWEVATTCAQWVWSRHASHSRLFSVHFLTLGHSPFGANEVEGCALYSNRHSHTSLYITSTCNCLLCEGKSPISKRRLFVKIRPLFEPWSFPFWVHEGRKESFSHNFTVIDFDDQHSKS